MDSDHNVKSAAIDKKKDDTSGERLPSKISNKSVQVEPKQERESLQSLPVNSKENFDTPERLSPFQGQSLLEASPKPVKQESNERSPKPVKQESDERKFRTNPVIITQTFDPHKEILREQPKRRTYYRTTVEHSRQAIYKVKCPNCHKRKYPTLYCHKEAVN